jgi:large subunit ribosomal protein L49
MSDAVFVAAGKPDQTGAEINTPASSTQVPPIPTTQKLPYHVERTKSNNFPVYAEYKSHGSLKLTLVRRISGDAHSLCRELASELGLEKGKYSVKHPANIVVLKGKFKTKVVEFLRNKGF